MTAAARKRLDDIVDGPKPAASASASTRVTKARRRRSCSRGGCACSGVALMNEPTPRRVSMTPAALELRVDPRHGVGVDAQVDRELADGRQLIAGLQPAGGDRRPQPAFELRVDRRRVAWVDGDDGHLISCIS